jgi:hypothetical protein
MSFAWLQAFCDWLRNTHLSQVFQNVFWIIPTMQSIHIASVAIVISSVLMLDLKLIGVIGRDQTGGAYAARYLPWVWFTLPVLLTTGTVLIIAEPSRELPNPAFQAKMAMLLTTIVVTFFLQRPLATQPSYWEATGGRRMTARAIVLVTLLLWVGVIFAGRWIAYMNIGGD